MPGIAKRVYEAVALGKFGDNSHPVHPATVHFPIAFLTLANTLNLIYGSMIYLPISPFFANDKENLATLTILGYGSNVLGILSSIPAIVTGGAELVAMIQGNGLYQTDKSGQKTLIPKVKMTLMHAGLNDLVIAGAVYNWLMERNVPDYRPAGHQIAMSAVFMGVQMYAAYLGGGLIYTHGVGVQRQGEGAKEKQKKQ